MVEVILQNQQKRIMVENDLEELAREVVERAIRRQGVEPEEVSLVFSDNQAIRQLNKQYRGIDEATDVLSFPMDEQYLGDIVISLERAREQAEEYGHSLTREVCFLTAHGVLHLLGYDHDREEDRVKMRREEEGILAELGLKRDES
ncbi:MAG: rRNA maturation RNase YbeY [Halanaerobium sp.]|nr:rRNA maturation RNase YbeY [Halanaerobium sp.]